MQLLQANTQIIVRIGPFVDATDGVTPETGITLGAADQAELLKNNGAGTVDISAATWAAVTGCSGWYDLTLTTSHTDTEGLLTIVIQDSSVCLPVFVNFMVMAQAAFTSMFTAKDAGFMDINIKTVGRSDTQETEANNLESACSNYSATRGLAGTALPAAAADAAGGLVISDAGGLDIDAKLANTNEVTVARMGALTDWINGGRLDLILDTIAADVVNIDGAAMRGTDNAALASELAKVPKSDSNVTWNTTALASINAEVDTALNTAIPASNTVNSINDILLDQLAPRIPGSGTISTHSAADVKTAIEAAGSSIALILADTNELETDWANGGRLDLILDAASAPSAAAVADAVWDEAISGHLTAGSTGAALNGASAPSAASVADAVWDEILSGHAGVGSTGAALSAAGGSGDPWATALPGAYGAGTAGKIIGDNINATISSRATQTSVDTIDGIVDTILVDTNELQTDLTNGGRLDLILDTIAADVVNIDGAAMRGTDNAALASELAKVPKSDSNVTWNATALASINAEVDTALNTAIPASNTVNSINDILLDQVAPRIPGSGTISTHSAADVKTAIEAGGSSIASILADTNELQTDLTNGGRLDSILDTIAADVVNIDGAAMRGTDNAALASVCTEARLSELDAGTAGKMANQVDIIQTDTTTDIQATLATIAGYVDTEIGAIINAIAALNNISAADVKTAMEAAGSHLALIKAVTDALGTASAAKLAASAGTIVQGTVSHDNTPATTTVFYASDITEATADHFNGRVIVFTSGAMQYQATAIEDYELVSGEGKFTVTALTEAPADNVTFIIV